MKFIRSIFDVFGYSPFDDLVKHNELCIDAVNLMVDFFESQNTKTLEKLREIERKADKLKDSIMKNVSSVLIPVDKYRLLNLITLQDNTINLCEDIVTLLSVKKVDTSAFKPLFEIISKISDAYSELFDVLRNLLAKAFVKSEIGKVSKIVDQISKLKEEFESKQADFMKSIADYRAEQFIFLKEVYTYLYRIVENISNSAKMFEYMLR